MFATIYRRFVKQIMYSACLLQFPLSLSVAIALSLPSFSLDNSISRLISRFLKLALSPPSIRIIYIILVFIRAFRCTYHVNIQCAQYVIAYVQGLNNVEIILQ